MHSSGGNTNASTQKPFQPRNVSVQIKKCSWQEHCSKTAPSEVHCSGGSLYMHCMYCTQNMLMHVHIFLWEGTEHSVFHIHGLQPHIGPVTTVCWCHYLTLCSYVPSWCSELQQFQRFAMWITFAASHQWGHKTERMESSAGTEQLLTNERGSTVRAARRSARQLHDRASAQSVCERPDHKVMWERVQNCYNKMLPVCVTGTPYIIMQLLCSLV